jgi:2-methylcitrate dehydratase PrpD
MMEKKAPVLYKLAGFIVGEHEFDNRVMHQARRVIADTYGTAFSGTQTAAFQSGIKSNETLSGKGPFPIWGTNRTAGLQAAVFYNALAIGSTDFDEGHRKAVGHPASLVVPTALVVGAFAKASFPEILRSLIIGYEIGTRFSHARIASKITTYSSGRWGAIAAAATAAVLLKLDKVQTVHALSNAAVLSPAMLGGSTDVSTGSMSKEGVAWAAQSGLQAAFMAKDGFSGPYLFVDEVDDYDKEKLLEGLGHSWLINSNYFKPYACCRWLHSPIEATLKMKEKSDFELSEIDQINIHIFQRAIDLVGSKYPENTVQAQFHLPFVIAVALLYGKVTPLFFTEAFLQKEAIRQLIDKMKMLPSEAYSRAFPDKLPSRVEIVLKDGRLYPKEIVTAPWDADCQPTDADLKAKFLEQTAAQGEALWNGFFHSE